LKKVKRTAVVREIALPHQPAHAEVRRRAGPCPVSATVIVHHPLAEDARILHMAEVNVRDVPAIGLSRQEVLAPAGVGEEPPGISVRFRSLDENPHEQKDSISDVVICFIRNCLFYGNKCLRK